MSYNLGDCGEQNEIAREIDYCARMQNLIYTRKKQQRMRNVSLEPYNTPPEGSEVYNEVGSIDGPGSENATSLVMSAKIPYGWDVYLQSLMTKYTGTNLVPTSNDMVWALAIDGWWIPGYNFINAQYGDFSFGLGLTPGVLAKSGQLVEIYVTIPNTFVCEGSTKIIAGVHGLIYGSGVARSN